MRHLLQSLFTLSLSILLMGAHALAQPVIGFQTFSAGFTKPVAIAHAGDPRLFVAEQPGLIRILNPDGQINATPFLDLRSKVNDNRNERGLLGLAFHPDYANNGFFYVNYTFGTLGTTRISRFSVSAGNVAIADPNSEQTIMEITQPYNNHNGGDLKFGPDGYLYIPTGDGGLGGDPTNSAQNGQNFLGKILRIDVDNGTPYGIPADNPFVGNASVKDEVWALGLRNPWRISFDRQNGDMWIADVGQDDFEEISRQPGGSAGGENYGWRCYEGFSTFNTGGCASAGSYDFPVYSFINIADTGESVTGGYVYRGNRNPNMKGYYIFGDFESGHVWAIKSDSAAGFPVYYQPQGTNRNFSSFGEDMSGELYAADHSRGFIYKLNDQTTPIDPSLGQAMLEIFPNPSGNRFKVRFSSPLGRPYTGKLINLSGQVVKEFNGQVQETFEIERGELPSGIYLIEIQMDRVYRGKIVFE